MVKSRFNIDDSLDVFACHGVGGTFGVLMLGVVGTKSVNAAGADGLFYGSSALILSQLIAALATIVISVVGTYVIVKVIGIFMTMKVTQSEEDLGLDVSMHNEVIRNAD